MDIKVRTKTRVSLIDCTRKNIGLYGKKLNELNYIVASEKDNVEVLGGYDTEERTAEVLEFIQSCIEEGLKQNRQGIIIIMPEK